MLGSKLLAAESLCFRGVLESSCLAATSSEHTVQHKVGYLTCAQTTATHRSAVQIPCFWSSPVGGALLEDLKDDHGWNVLMWAALAGSIDICVTRWIEKRLDSSVAGRRDLRPTMT